MSESNEGNGKTCIVTGVGPGTGSALVKRFAEGGYTVAMIARDEERLAGLAAETPNTHPYPCNVLDADGFIATIEKIKADLGDPAVVVHNAVSAAFGDFMEIKPRQLERTFQINTMALLHLAQLTAPAMIEKGEGAILATSNTATYRGKAAFAGFAPTKAAQRILMESIARRLGPEGVHAGYIVIDAAIDVPWAREAFADKPDDWFCKPADIAEEVYHVAHQPRSAWTFDVMIRPFGEEW